MGAGAVNGFFSPEVTLVDSVGLGFGRWTDWLLDLCISLIRSEARPPEATMKSQRGMRIAMLYSLARMLAKWSRMYSLSPPGAYADDQAGVRRYSFVLRNSRRFSARKRTW